MIPAGRIGLCVSAFSFVDGLKLSVSADEGVCKHTKFLTDRVYNNVMSEIERMKDVPVPDNKEKELKEKKED